MGSIDNRIVSMTFDNAKFEAGVAKTMATLVKFDASLKKIGTENGLGNIQKAADKLNFSGADAALNKLNAKIASVGAGNTSFSQVEASANKVTFGPLGTAIENIKGKLSSIGDAPGRALDALKAKLGFKGAEQGFVNIENAANKVKLEGPGRAADAMQRKLQFPGVEKSFANIEASASKVTLGGMNTAITNVTKGFSILEGAASVAIGGIAAKAALAGGAILKNLSVGPLQAGFQEYATNLNSIQTILANTKFEGANLKDVNGALAELNKYSDQTIYNFSEMAKNIGTFTAAGVGLKQSTESIKGIANLAALSGSNSQQASTAMYQLSQAIASGRVSLQDWNSVVNAGMGGATFQRALATTAENMGTIEKGALKIDKATGKATINGNSFRESITAKPGEESWLTSDVLVKTLGQFTGDLTDAELAAQGFNAEQIKVIQETAKTAKKAATEVKTITQAYDVVRESMGSGWAATFQLIFGDFEEAKTLFTNVTAAITGFVGANADARNKVLSDWKELGGRTNLIKGIQNAFEALVSVVTPIKDAFREVFPAKTGKDLADLTERFVNFTEKLKIGPETAENLKRTFAGFFAVLSIGKQIITGILSVFGDLLGALGKGSGGFLNITGSVGDFLVSVDKALKEGGRLAKVFDLIGAVLSVPIKALGALGDILGEVFGSGGATDQASSAIDDLTGTLSPLEKIVEGLGNAWDSFVDAMKRVADEITPEAKKIVDEVGGLVATIADAFVNLNFDTLFEGIQTGLIAGIFVAIKKGLGSGFNIDIGGGVLKNLSGSLDVLTGSLKTMQRNVQADTMLKIALAIGALAVGVKLLSTIDPKRLTTAMTAIGVGLGQLVGGMALLTKIGGYTAFLQMPFIAGSLVLLAGALNVLAIAVKIFSTMSWEELAKGLAGVGGSLVALSFGVAAIPKSIVLIGPALLPIAVALNILAVAMKIFATMSWVEIAKGLVGVAGGLTALGLGMKSIGPSILLVGPGLIAAAIGLNLVALAVRSFGTMSLGTLAKGIGGIAASLIVLGIAITAIPPTVALQAAGLALLSVALTGIAASIALMGSLPIKTLAKGITAMGLSLVVLGAGLMKMTKTIPGSIALLAAATALGVLAPVLILLGTAKFTTIAKGLAAMAGILGVLAAAGILASGPITALGIALLALGASAVLVGTGVYLLASGLAKLGGEGSKGITAAMVALTAFIVVLPKMIIDFLKGLVGVLAAIAQLAPKVVDSMVKILDALIDVVIKSAPRLAEAVVTLIAAFIKVLTESAPAIVAAGFKLLLSLLSGIDNNILKVLETAGSIIVKFLTGIAVSLPRIVAAGLTVLVKFLEGLVSKIGDVVTAAVSVIVKFLQGITENMPRIVKAGVDLIVGFVKGIAENVGKLITAGADLITKILKGIGDNVGKVAKAATDMIEKFFNAAVKAALDMADAGAKAVINFINGVAAAIRKHGPELGKAGGNLGAAIIEGAISGMSSMASEFISRALNIFDGLPKAVKKFLGINSPSRVFMEIGSNVMKGMVSGVDSGGPFAVRSVRSAADGMVNAMSDSLSAVPDLLDGLMDLDPTITPVLDLSQVEAGARRLGEITNVVPITAAASYNNAAAISSEQQQNETAQAEPALPPKEIKFEQNNYSPESLSDAEIYRQTKNQLSQAKDALGLAI